ncbi:ATP-binding protein [Jiangella sp. DSM 45060]|uniref:sensor histidine kinase n=1 Tax=Jiangella sp. DSM 45060 TaxID=1798224 RepID=UPI00087A4205|nr:ATP-binding protein [Jiangella sp. DSM 45060]SDT43517.1 two-component system, OmpR family, sensor histidine kinase MprB [Jiangella sp. DSM 45060]
MTLRARLALLTSAAVALAVVAASVAAWLLIRASLLDEIDQRLLSRIPDVEEMARTAAELPQGSRHRISLVMGNEPLGLQTITPDGAVEPGLPPGNDPGALVLDDEEQRMLAGEIESPLLRSETIDGEDVRVMTASLDAGGALRLVQPLANVHDTLTRIAWLLAGITGVGVAAAAALGWTTARTGLRPIDRLVDAAEQVATTKDLAHRIDPPGNHRDEVARLAGSVNAMLAALDDARTQQRQLVEDAGHELRTPLTTLRNDLGVLLRSEQHPDRRLAPSDRAGLLRDLEAEAAALSDMVGEIVELARGGAEPEPLLETDLRALVDRAAARTRRIDPAVTVTVAGRPFEAVVHPVLLERAVANLIRNAVQVSPPGGAVEVLLDETADGARVRVLDRGPGISDGDLPRIFDRFYRGQAARERHGSGLGLAIVAQAAELHGGSVTAGRRKGGGAAFSLVLPQPILSPLLDRP